MVFAAVAAGPTAQLLKHFTLESRSLIFDSQDAQLEHRRMRELGVFPYFRALDPAHLSKCTFIFSTPAALTGFLDQGVSGADDMGYIRFIRIALSGVEAELPWPQETPQTRRSLGLPQTLKTYAIYSEQWRAAFRLLPKSVETIVVDFEGLGDETDCWISVWETVLPKLSTLAYLKTQSRVTFDFAGCYEASRKADLEIATLNCAGAERCVGWRIGRVGRKYIGNVEEIRFKIRMSDGNWERC